MQWGADFPVLSSRVKPRDLRMGSGLARRTSCPLIVCERGGAGSTGSEGSTGKVRRKK